MFPRSFPWPDSANDREFKTWIRKIERTSREILPGSTDWTPGTVNAAASSSVKTLTVTGARQGDKVHVAEPYDMQGCVASGYVKQDDTVALVISNLTGGNKTFGSGTWRVAVHKWQ